MMPSRWQRGAAAAASRARLKGQRELRRAGSRADSNADTGAWMDPGTWHRAAAGSNISGWPPGLEEGEEEEEKDYEEEEKD